MFTRNVAVICILLFVFCGYSQDTTIIKKWLITKAGKPIIKSAGVSYFFRKFDMEQGIEDPYILRIRERRNGEILYGTAGNGAGIYDGFKMKSINVTNGLKNNVVQDVFEDNLGNLWFATSGGGVCVYNGISFKYFDKKNDFPDNSVWVIYQDKKNNFWFGTENSGLCFYDGKTFKTYSKKDGLCSQNIREIFEDKQGNLWLGSNSEGISVFDGKTFKNYNTKNGLTFNGVLGIDQDKKGNIWLATYGGGLILYKNGIFKNYGKQQGLSNLLICDVLCDSKGNVWVATSGGGMFLYDGKIFHQFSTAEGMSNNIVISLLEDKYGNIWAGTYGGGICQYTAKQFTYLSETEGLPNNVVRGIVNSYDSSLYFVTSGGGFCNYNGKEFKSYSTPQGLSSNFIMGATTDKLNRLWLATSGGGICKFDGKYFYKLNSTLGLKTNYFLSIITGSKNEIYAGAYGGGLSIIKENEIIHYGPKDGLPSIYINSITQDKQNNIWLGTETGLYELKDNKICQIRSDIFNANNQILTLYSDAENNLWIGTDGHGVYRLMNNVMQNVTNENGLCNNHVKSIIIDDKTGVWIGTSNGIAYLKPKSKKTASLNDYEIKNYNRPEGYTGSNCLLNSINIDKNNRIWLGTGRKLLCINTANQVINKISPTIKLESIELFFKNVNWKKYSDSGFVKFYSIEKWSGLPNDLILPYNNNHITFNFSGINLNCPEKTKYKFILEGLDNNWSPITYSNKAIYSNIPPGKYEFKVISFNENNVQSKEIAVYNFEISPPWWQTLWFKTLIVFCLLIFVILFVKWRERKLKRDKEILKQKVKEQTHELSEKNEELLQQNEEISTQRDEIEAQRDEITAQCDLVIIQKEQIETIHKEISQSIDYATRLQTAILSDIIFLNKYLFESFILYKPKDKVSGDFYWWTVIENQLVITVADCTGHGVPGAFMSMLGTSFLREIVIKEYMTNPAIILKRLRKEIINSLKQRGQIGEQKDGMDMSLITINTETNECQWAGANNPLYIIRSNSDLTTFEKLSNLEELKGDKMPISIHERMEPFTNHDLKLEKGDCLYLFSDGYADQFGGPKGKKFMYKQFKELLFTNSQKLMQEQKDILDKTINEWIGNGEQIDDITVLGIKI
ncbi:MAG: hypothetical protein A2X08_10355 [Bacteroidetes bacterium GWA2_32_17]|nr:MAG: hypothetical protein A2X08_10355 [Bacteroidetes bacterium GWA2_32_17]